MLQSHLPRRPCGGRRSKIATANSDYRVAAELPRQHTVAVTFATGAARRIWNLWRQKICGCRTVAVWRPCGGRMFLTNTTAAARRPHGARTAAARGMFLTNTTAPARRPHGARTVTIPYWRYSYTPGFALYIYLQFPKNYKVSLCRNIQCHLYITLSTI